MISRRHTNAWPSATIPIKIQMPPTRYLTRQSRNISPSPSSLTKSFSSVLQFRAIKHAYDILSDPQKRQVYDRHGEFGVNMMNTVAGKCFKTFFYSRSDE